jgi:hypothetical protein
MATDIEKWNAWIKHLSQTSGNTAVKVSNIEKTLKEYQNKSMRMLWITQLLLIGLVGLNGLLLFYK